MADTGVTGLYWLAPGFREPELVRGRLPAQALEQFRNRLNFFQEGLPELQRGVVLRSVEGLHDFNVRVTDRPRLGQPGSFSSPQFPESKEIIISCRIVESAVRFPPESGGGIVARSLAENLDEFRRLTQFSVTEPGRLVYWPGTVSPGNQSLYDSRGRYITCRIVGRALPFSVEGMNAGYVDAVLRFRAEDPVIYSLAEEAAVMRGFAPAEGFDFEVPPPEGGLDFPGASATEPGGLDFPSAQTALVVNNEGNTDTYPRFTVQGHTSDLRVIRILNTATGAEAVFSKVPPSQVTGTDPDEIVLPVGQRLTVDMDPTARSVILGDDTAQTETSAFELWRVPRVPFRLQPGDNTLKYLPDTAGGGTVSLNWRHAWL